MELELRINGVVKSLEVAPNESLLTVLRREGCLSVKQGCESGECGACTVLVEDLPRPGCTMLATQAGGCTLMTCESLGSARKLHPLQEAFIEAGAVQCGFCTPGMLLSAYALLRRNAHPSEDEVREALSGNLCRCGGYARPVQAVMLAAARMRGNGGASGAGDMPWTPSINGGAIASTQKQRVADTTPLHTLPRKSEDAGRPQGVPLRSLRSVGQPERRVDAVKLVTGKSVFVDDVDLRGMLHARLLTSPHAHAVIRGIDVSQARALPGVQAVLTYRDVATAATGVPPTGRPQEPGPGQPQGHIHHPTPHLAPTGGWLYDRHCLDDTVRFVGDRIAVVAAETAEIAERALSLIQVEYEVLPAVLDARQAIEPASPRLHAVAPANPPGVYNASRNIAAHISVEVGNVERGFAESDLVVENEYAVPQVQQAPIENHVAMTYWDDDDRLVVRSNTCAPHYLRSTIAALVGLPPARIRVIKAQVGGDFGARQDMALEDLCALLSIATHRPVRLAYSRGGEFVSSQTLPAQVIRMKTGVKQDGTIVTHAVMALANSGAYGLHAQQILHSIGLQALPLYPCSHMRFVAQTVYTNLPPTAYMTQQASFALESQVDEIAMRLGMDALEFRRKNWLVTGDNERLSIQAALALSPGEPALVIESCGLPRCLQIVEEKLGWKEKRSKGNAGRFRRGVGIALSWQATTAQDTGLSAASIRLNEDGSCSLLASTVDGGSGSDTLLAQIAAEVLGVRLADIIIPSSLDTDVMPFDSGRSASSAIYACGNAVKRAAEQVRRQALEIAGRMLGAQPETLTINEGIITSSTGRHVTLAQVAQQAFYGEHAHYIEASASETGDGQSPAFAAHGTEVEVDTETGVVRVLKVISAIDAGKVINPLIAEGQVQGGVTRALGSALCEEMVYDQQGQLLTDNLRDYRIYDAPDMPVVDIYMVETVEPAGPFGAKSGLDGAANGVPAAIANAVSDALGIRMRQLPLTPERILRAIHAASTGK